MQDVYLRFVEGAEKYRSHGEAMQISFNGKDTGIEDGTSVDSLLLKLKIKKELVVVELNLKIVDKSRYSGTLLSPGDKVECISFMGGG
jgi:sulfur carrier protein